MTKIDRRTVLYTGGLALGHGSLALTRAAADGRPGSVHPPGAAPQASQDGSDTNGEPTMNEDVLPSFPSTDPEVAGAVVGAAHSDIDAVADLVTARPHLARAAVDWGFGDWESALGAASHVGRRDIAELLLAHGARPSIFSAAMLGQLEVVRAMVEASPGVQHVPGPHGIPLVAHARAGGDAAAAVHDFLAALGDADAGLEVIELDEAERGVFVGRYAFEARENAIFEVVEERGALSLRRQGRPFGRRLFAVSRNEFYPTGSPTVRVVFEVESDGSARLRIVDDAVVLEATRAG